MKSLKLFFRYTFVLLLLLLSSAGRGKNDSSDIQLVASTPCDDLIKKILLIPATTKVDFIRWNIILHAEQQNKTFKLHIRFGESQPNTLGFMNGGQEKTVEGSFTSSKEAGSMHGEVYHLKSAGLSSELLMVKMNEEIFHLLSPQKTTNGR